MYIYLMVLYNFIIEKKCVFDITKVLMLDNILLQATVKNKMYIQNVYDTNYLGIYKCKESYRLYKCLSAA